MSHLAPFLGAFDYFTYTHLRQFSLAHLCPTSRYPRERTGIGVFMSQRLARHKYYSTNYKYPLPQQLGLLSILLGCRWPRCSSLFKSWCLWRGWVEERESLRASLASNSYRLFGLWTCYKKWAPLFKFSYTCRFMLVQVQQVQTSEMGFCWCVQYSARLQAVVPKMNILSTTGKWSGQGFSLSCYLISS